MPIASGSLTKNGWAILARFRRSGLHCSFPRLFIHPILLAVNLCGIPHLAKNERDMGHPSLVREPQAEVIACCYGVVVKWAALVAVELPPI